MALRKVWRVYLGGGVLPQLFESEPEARLYAARLVDGTDRRFEIREEMITPWIKVVDKQR